MLPPFDYEDYQAASVFFTQSLGQLVTNAKLDRPLDSHAPQTEYMYQYDDDWGEEHEYGSEDPWEEPYEGYQNEYDYEAYPTEAEGPDEDNEWECHDAEQEDNQDGALDEGDQDTYE
jgi:hypothetical protein